MTELYDKPFFVDLCNLPLEGKQLSGSVPMTDVELIEEDRLKFPELLVYDLNVSYVDKSVLVRGTLSTSVKFECDRCLDFFTYKINIPDVCYYYENYSDDQIDLTEQVREDILINFPQRWICTDACKGLCIDCGTNLNKSTCSCARQVIKDDEKPGNAAWDALDNLDL